MLKQGFSLAESVELQSGATKIRQLDNTLRSSFLFCVLIGVLTIVAGIWFGKGTIPKNYVYVAALVYGIYAVVSLTV